ncbi:hypothetical protein Dda_9300 [Drechslerella dactyloides]|uniref:Uncharacterized protein n=1 Tax=Drechslerella dactyloides TaxID=74499 RepID=A0AAD6IS54_DREDA|nr:hypothetical protein Dda_9300 [Drechslerella dactyloides]
MIRPNVAGKAPSLKLAEIPTVQHSRPRESAMTLPAELPGYGLPVTFENRKAFPHGLLDYWYTIFLTHFVKATIFFSPSIRTLREINMVQAMNQITDKVEWTVKMRDPQITEKWKAEMKAQLNFTDNMFDWCLEELKDKAEQLEDENFLVALDGDVCKSDTMISEEIRRKINDAVQELEDIPEKLKDWHPGSDGLVLDIVHPSLFPLVYSVSRILKDRTINIENCIENAGTGVAWEANGGDAPMEKLKGRLRVPNAWSKRFQWLPADISLHRDEATGERTMLIAPNRFESYINNLHPRHTELYRLIEHVIAKSIPMWSQTLIAASMAEGTKLRVDWGIEYDFDEEDEPEDLYSPTDDDYRRSDKLTEWIVRMRNEHIFIPDAPAYRPWRERIPNVEKVLKKDLWKKFRDKGLQVIVKLASIHLTPEKSRYPGGSWHLEGQLNDRICATSIYYYSNENVEASCLKFRQEINEEESMDWPNRQNEDEFMLPFFGIDNGDAAIQVIGDVATTQGRLITFPNTLQHQVQPFELADKTKPGHRKILAVFLVDPYTRVISTANIPPQRKDWWAEDLELNGGGRLNKLPREIRDMVIGDVEGFPIDMELAKQLRLELMEERKTFVDSHNAELKMNTFFLCEH